MSSERGDFHRLPTNIVPRNYDITLKPNFNDFTFEGSENVTLNVLDATSTIQLNAADLVLKSASWRDENGKGEQVPTTIELEAVKELLTLGFDPPISPGKGILNLSFQGTLNDKLTGFYRSKYKGPNGEERYNAVTQFAPTDARRCFPCWDEPAIKATFDIHLIAAKNKVALSNMPVKSVAPYESDDNLHIVSYDRSPIMSSYLVAVVIGEFDYLEALSADGSVVCRVYTPVGKKEQGRFALEVCAKVLPYYTEYFGIAYPLPKIDLLAIGDFAFGAMENWGLVTYRETRLLVDEKETSAFARQAIALTVGHEIAHQWFGNLVTMDWWDGLFLNEGYASFVEFMCVDYLFPNYDIWTQFVTGTHNRALDLDCLKNSHPVEVPVNDPSEINEIFDAISYSKGATIIRMLYEYIGDNDFKKGMRIYLTRHQYNNTTTSDLWQALGEASNKPIADVMNTWTKQMGFPILKITSKQDGQNRILTVTQQKFCADAKSMEVEKNDKKYHWIIPLAFISANDPSQIVGAELMSTSNKEVTIHNVNEDQWVKLNPRTIGYYRVQYTSEMLDQFLPAIQDKSMGPLDRLGLLDDLFALVRCGENSTVDIIRFLKAFVNEHDYTVWTAIDSVLAKISLLLAYTPYYNQFQMYGQQIFKSILASVGWTPKENESHLQTMLRSLVLNRLISFDHQLTLNEALSRFKSHESGENIIPADLRSAVYRAALSLGDENTAATLLKMYRESDMIEEKNRIAGILGAAKNPEVLKEMLNFSISDDVRSQNSTISIVSVGTMSTVGRELAWKFFKDNWKIFHERYPGGQLVCRLITGIVGNFVTEDKAVEAREFFKEHPFPGTERTVEQAIESILLNQAWLNRDQNLIQEFFVKA